MARAHARHRKSRSPGATREGGAPRRVVVTGGAGFLGSHLCTALVASGAEVVALDNFLTGSPANVAHLMHDPGFRLVRCDVTDFVHVPGPVDLVLHFASPASPVDYLRMPVETLKVGSLGTWHALGLAKEKGARFVLASTSEVYGDPQVPSAARELLGARQPDRPTGRLRRGQALRGGADDGVPGRTRASTPASSGSSTPTARGCGRTTAAPSRPSSGRPCSGSRSRWRATGRQTRSVCFVDDLVRGVLAFAASGHPGPVNLGNPEELTVLASREDVLAAVGSASAIEHIALPVDDPKVRRPDTTLAEELLGWRPRVPWTDGLARTVEWFAQASLEDESATVVGGAPRTA